MLFPEAFGKMRGRNKTAGYGDVDDRHPRLSKEQPCPLEAQFEII